MPLLNTVIDLSHFNSVSSFDDVKNDGIVGVIHKATQGTGFVDSRYDSRKTRALAAGLLWGAYHFGVGGNIPGQVDHFLNVVGPGPADLLVLDFEPNTQGATMTLAEAEQFVQLVKDKTGRFPGLYSGESFIKSKVGSNTNTVLKNCFLWVAKFNADQPTFPPAWKTFTFWQYTDGNNGPQPHQVNGVGRCDRDKFNGTAQNLNKLWGVK